MTEPAKATVLYQENVDTMAFDWGKIHMLVDEATTGATRMSFGIAESLPGTGHERHNHPDADEVIFVLSGKAEMVLDDQPPVEVEPGACVYLPAGVYHSAVNNGSEPFRTIIVYVPSGAEKALRKIPGCRIIPAKKS